MILKKLVLFIFLGLIVQCKTTELHTINKKSIAPFGISYARVDPSEVSNYNMIIIEPDFYTPADIYTFKRQGPTVIAYVTLGEVDKYRWYYPDLEEIGFLGINENWDSPFLDLEDPETRKLMLDKVIPRIIEKGVDGLFLDTVDAVSPYTSRNHLAPYMLELIRGIRERYPNIVIIQNAGLFLLEETKDVVDAVAIEDVATMYNFDTKEYKIVTDDEYEERLALVRTHSKQSGLPFLIIDFAVTPETILTASNRLRAEGFPYFISNISLNTLPENPAIITNLKEQ